MSSRVAVILTWVVAGVAAFFVAALVVLRLNVDSDFLEEVLNSALVPATKGIYEVDVGDLSYSLMAGEMVVRDLSIAPVRRTIDSLNALGNAPRVQFSASLEEVSIRNVNVVRLLLRRELVAGEFSVDNPLVQITTLDRSEEEDPAVQDSTLPDTTDHQRPGGRRYLRRLRYLEIRSVQIANINASLVMIGPTGTDRRETNLTNRLEGLSLNLENLVIDPSRPQDLSRIAFAEDVRIDFEQLYLELPGEKVLDLGPLSSSTLDKTIQVGGISIVPTYTEQEFLNGNGPAGDRLAISTGPISLEGLDFRRAFSQLTLHARLAYVDKFAIHVMSDKHRHSAAPGPNTPAAMPHDVFRELRFPVTVDTVKFENAEIAYVERSEKADAPGSITIDEIDAVVTNLSNDRLVADPARPTRIGARGKLFGATPTWADVEMPLMSPPPTMNLRAGFGRFDPKLANSILPPLEGLRVTEGEVDTAWLDISYRPQKAMGSLVVIYRDLDVRMEDRDSGDQNFGDMLGSIFADVGLHGANDPDPGKRPKVGKVDYEVSLDKPFFKIFWEPIRGGLIDLIKRF